MSLRNRVADLIDQAPVSRRLWFAPPMKLSLAAVGAVAVLALAVILVGSQMVGPAPSQTPEPSASASTEPTASAQPSATLEPTPVPTLTPTPGVAAWTGVAWSVGTTAEGSWWTINDVVAWRDGYVGVGSSMHGALSQTSTTSPAFFASSDGLHWTIVQEDDPIDHGLASTSDEFFPKRIVPVGDTLLAVGPIPPAPIAPRLWRSEDGSTWSLLDNSSWNEAMSSNALLSVAGGPRGVVVVGAVGNSGAKPQGPPVLIHSSDGLTWDRIELSSSVFQGAYFRDVTAYAGGFVIVGRVGEADVLEPGVGMPAAWTSPDGVVWLAAEVEGPYVTGARLETVIAGAEGLFATGRQTDTPDLSGQGPLSGWASTDGRSWQLLGEMGTDLPLVTGNPAMVVGDGEHMVMFGRESCKTTELLAWTSLDGVTWTQLGFSGETSSLPTISGPICNDDGTEGSTVGSVGVSYAAVMPDGVFVVTSSSAPTSPGYWFLSAVTQ
jgi:hypothetical protein